jgi:hypothetical protein
VCGGTGRASIEWRRHGGGRLAAGEVFHQADVPKVARWKLLGHLAESAKTKPPAYWSADDMQAHRLRTAAHLALTLPEFQLA